METDRWGFAETEYVPAIQILASGEETRRLVRKFVPFAAERAEGFADFRKNATKSISLLDRLRSLRLPELSDVETGLRQHKSKEERFESLTEAIENLEEELDRIVYGLYGLENDEIETIESSLD
jgi:hypothetical protein